MLHASNNEFLVSLPGKAELGGPGGARAPQYIFFLNYKELVRKSVLCPPNIESLTVPPPPKKNLKVVPRSLFAWYIVTITQFTVLYQ